MSTTPNTPTFAIPDAVRADEIVPGDVLLLRPDYTPTVARVGADGALVIISTTDGRTCLRKRAASKIRVAR